ncbi:MAG: T9SS type A sorting domain-containing protein [Chitinophagales bacterium]|nr:T9SS type A sorting domain-containing protein [Chitinophagales bacterium]
MKNKFLFMAVMIMGMITAHGRDFFYAVKYPNSYTIYQNEKVIGTINATNESQMLTILNASKSTQPTVVGNVVSTSQGGIQLPYSGDTVLVTGSNSKFIAIANDTIWYLKTNNSTNWQPVIPIDSVLSIDYQNNNDTFVVLMLRYDSDESVLVCSYGSPDYGPSGGDVVLGDSAISAMFLFGVNYFFSETSAILGTLNVSITELNSIENSHKFCEPNGCVYVYFDDLLPLQNLNYLREPYLLGLDDTLHNKYLYHLPNIELKVVKKLVGSVSASIDCPGIINWDTSFSRSNQHYSINKGGDGVNLKGKEQRFFLRRIEFPGYGRQGFCCGFNLGKTWYQKGHFWSVDDINAVNNFNQLNQYDSLGRFKATYPASDSHDGMVCDSFSVLFGWFADSVATYQPPLIINNNSQQQYTIHPPNNFPPMKWDSCSVANALPSQLIDADHVNSIFMTWIEPLNCYLVLRSSRNLAKWPISWPLSAWRFYPNAPEPFLIDTQLVQLINSSAFGFDRDAGHDFQFEAEGFGQNSWIISQFDNRSCEVNSGGHSNAHYAQLTYDSIVGWALSKIKIFPGLPTGSMSNTDMWTMDDDTFVIVNSSAGPSQNAIPGIIKNSPVSFFDFHSHNQIGAWEWGTVRSGARPVAYQVNATGEKFSKPEFDFDIKESKLKDSLVITSLNLPKQGTWYWWLGNKLASMPLVISKNDIPFEGLSLYISGQFDSSDTIPNNQGPLSRFISNPKELKFNHLNSIEESNSLSKITLYPNPTSGNLFIKGVLVDAFTQVTITDCHGRTVGYYYSNELNIGDIPKGFYFLTIKKGNSIATKKFVRL